MRPDIVARTLASVEEEWRSQAAVFVDCNASSADGKVCQTHAFTAFSKSCAKVVDAIVQGSDGDRENAKEYMSNVCGQSSLVGWQKVSCTDLAIDIIDRGMNANSYANRQKYRAQKACKSFWSKFLDSEEKRKAQEAIERAEQEKKAAEEAAEAKKKAEEEAAEAKKIAEEKAKAESERQAQEKALREKEEKEQHEADVERQAAEAKARAAEAAERLAQKRAEAEQMQKEAQEKLEEAAKAEAEHKAAIAEHERAQELLRNATHAAGNVSIDMSNSTAVTASPQNLTSANATKVDREKPADVQKNASDTHAPNSTN